MPRTTRALVAVLAVTVLAALSGGSAVTQGQENAWTSTRLTGGPAYDLAITPVIVKAKPYDKLTQSILAAGPEVLSMDRGADWVARPGTGPMANAVAGPQGVAYVSSLADLAYRTRDFGKTWSRVSVRQSDAVRFLAVSPDYAFDKAAYAMTLDDWRLYDTSNDGGTWQEVKVEVEKEYENAGAAYSPEFSHDETAFVATSLGVYMWTRDIRKWTLMSKPGGGTPAFGSAGGPATSQGLLLPAEYGDDLDRRADPVLHTVFAYNARGVYRSDNDGETWTPIPLPAGVEQVNDLAVSNGWPADPVLAVAVEAPGVIGYVSSDDGKTWREVTGRDGMAGTSVAMAVDFAPVPDPDRDFAGTVYLPSMYKHSPIVTHPPHVPPYNGSREIFLATDGDGVYRSTDAGMTWTGVDPSFADVQVTALAFLPGDSQSVLAGTDTAGLYRSDDGGASWRFVDTGLPRGRGQTIRQLRVSPAFPQDRTVFLAAMSGVWVSTDGGGGWRRTEGPQDAHTLAVSPAYAADRSVLADGWLSLDGGGSWAQMPGAGAYPWTAAAFSPDYATDGIVWWGTDAVTLDQRFGLRRWDKESQQWVPIEKSEVVRDPVTAIAAIRVDTAEPVRLFVGMKRGLQQSFDNGTTWERGGPAMGLVRDVQAWAVSQPFANGVILAANVEGASWSTSRGASWTRDPRSPRDARVAGLSLDGRTFLVAGAVSVARYQPPADLLGAVAGLGR